MVGVLITGITGMVGSHLADFLLKEQRDCQIYGVKRWRSPINNIARIIDRLTLIDADLTDASACIDLIETVRPDLVFHLAAHTFVLDSFKSPQKTINDNIGMQLNLLEAIRQAKLDTKIHVAGSSEEYGAVYPDELPVNESNPLRPLSPYGVSKVGQDMLAYQYFRSYKMKITRTRAFNHTGPRRGEVFVCSSFAKQIAEIEADLKPPVVYVGNLDAQRDWSDVRDIVRAYWLCLERCEPGEVYVLGSGVAHSIKETLEHLLSFTKRKIEVVTDPKRLRPSDIPLLIGDPSRFQKKTGWCAEYSFEQTLLDLLNYWREQIKSRQRQASSAKTS